MTKDSLELYGNVGYYLSDGNIISFQLGEGQQLFATPNLLVPQGMVAPFREHVWLGVQGYNICARGVNNNLCDEVALDIKQNRLLPRLYSKQINMLYGHGPTVYKEVLSEGKLKREYIQLPEVDAWLHSWQENGMETSVEEFALSCIKNFYYFHDFFVKWRFSRGKDLVRGTIPVVGLECLENRHCRLATSRMDVATELIHYKDFHHIALGRWGYGISNYKIYPKFALEEFGQYKYAAISHHREKSINEFYGVNETHQGARPYIMGSNHTANYINSFLKNSLAAKIHIIIPNAWVDSKRKQITNLCAENKK